MIERISPSCAYLFYCIYSGFLLKKTPHLVRLLLLFYLMRIDFDWEKFPILCVFVLLHLLMIFIEKISPSCMSVSFILSNGDRFWLREFPPFCAYLFYSIYSGFLLRKSPHRVCLLLLFYLMRIDFDWEKFPILCLFVLLHLFRIFIQKISPSCMSASFILSNGDRFWLREFPHPVLASFIAPTGGF